jgi:hypothetical protein
MSQPTLFDLLEVVCPIGDTTTCHDCGGPLTESDATLPHTCERDLACVACCQSCHHAALDRIMRRESPFPATNAGRPIKRRWSR